MYIIFYKCYREQSGSFCGQSKLKFVYDLEVCYKFGVRLFDLKCYIIFKILKMFFEILVFFGKIVKILVFFGKKVKCLFFCL